MKFIIGGAIGASLMFALLCAIGQVLPAQRVITTEIQRVKTISLIAEKAKCEQLGGLFEIKGLEPYIQWVTYGAGYDDMFPQSFELICHPKQQTLTIFATKPNLFDIKAE